MADQAMYHQGNQSVFVGGRLWTLLPPPALFRKGEDGRKKKREVLHLFRCYTHTLTFTLTGNSSQKGDVMYAMLLNIGCHIHGHVAYKSQDQ